MNLDNILSEIGLIRGVSDVGYSRNTSSDLVARTTFDSGVGMEDAD
jgi:hypothetical protein